LSTYPYINPYEYPGVGRGLPPSRGIFGKKLAGRKLKQVKQQAIG